VDSVVVELLHSMLPDRSLIAVCFSSALDIETQLQQGTYELLVIVLNNLATHPSIAAANNVEANLAFAFNMAQTYRIPLILFASRIVIDVQEICGPKGCRWTALPLPFSLRDFERAVERLSVHERTPGPYLV